ncbi:2-dehydro-3-deoxyphosphogalactonate aldolase [Rhodobium orientis]|uniref:2-dehydro-3-deoxy-6-phosphogalactonate aldolase n=1 Tax=Rhodobium orientis TaxID=34017 RepID=A0A327JKD5_9HYPH|nr:2-dehydro-3-deoxy-6-phosphogalactonate aldolase [Rhodobium orientis]MBB4304749.1 2-dehydro-3-deoxyphosphogalactonate aldolase [Rhodobium orientis]MBK5952047.1 2-dehydro-3-deoxy-6-phosphogalactonate aldolase [Rhodobium orientis]RAI26551.1 2-dehydro-3-deoxy-6-phosphogalactonate aldolase [Rhodobium orientis]
MVGANPRKAFDAAFARLPLVAILRGITPAEAPGILHVLVDAGFTLIEVPLNSPDPFQSIEAMANVAPEGVRIGAGTVLDPGDVSRLVSAGGSYVVTPNTDLEVIAAATDAGLPALIGCFTPSECFAAAKAGASALKIFPASRLGSGYIKDLKAVLPADLPVLAVGGVGAVNFADFVAAGCSGFGVGSELWKPGRSAEDVHSAAETLVAAWRAIAP